MKDVAGISWCSRASVTGYGFRVFQLEVDFNDSYARISFSRNDQHKWGIMSYYLNYEGGKIHFSLPEKWNVLSSRDCASASVIEDVAGEIERALDNPIGTPTLEELARPDMNAVVLFDDIQRATPANLAIPAILNRLNKAGLPDERVTAICAMGTHPLLNDEQLHRKAGEEAFRRLKGRIYNHEAQSSDNILIGRTHRGTIVEINKHVAQADLVIGIGTCMPHPWSGFGGGAKIVMPGVSSYRAIGDHHYTWIRHRNCKLNLLDGNPFFEDMAEIARISGLAFKLDFLLNETDQVIRAFAGDPVEEHQQASEHAASIYLVPLPKQADVVITSAAPLEIGIQSEKALINSKFATRAGGTVIWVASQKRAGPLMELVDHMATAKTANDYHHMLVRGDIPKNLRAYGISFIMLGIVFKELSEKFNVIHVTEGFSREQVEKMNFAYAPSLDAAIQQTYQKMPQADVAIFPSGGTIIPSVK